MHELSLCQSLLDRAHTLAREHHAISIRCLTVQIGPLSGVEPHLLAQAFPIARAGTLANDAHLVIEKLPLRVQCASCGAETDAEPNQLLCGSCGDYRTRLVSGDELLLMSIELQTD